ncbi:hypothetical protein L218DRAFT_984864 [Marasmius fiardii PR-910]|nr:hypothetical protein L218DRAFT_984864 [Marasmius fiardii PR-910]
MYVNWLSVIRRRSHPRVEPVTKWELRSLVGPARTNLPGSLHIFFKSTPAWGPIPRTRSPVEWMAGFQEEADRNFVDPSHRHSEESRSPTTPSKVTAPINTGNKFHWMGYMRFADPVISDTTWHWSSDLRSRHQKGQVLLRRLDTEQPPARRVKLTQWSQEHATSACCKNQVDLWNQYQQGARKMPGKPQVPEDHISGAGEKIALPLLMVKKQVVGYDSQSSLECFEAKGGSRTRTTG